MRQIPIQRIPLPLIDQEDHRFRLLPFDDPPSKAMAASIERWGLLHPPLLKAVGGGRFLIVAGRKRLRLALEVMRLAGCDCLVLPEDFDPLATLALALDEAMLAGPVSPLEGSVFCQKALALCPEEEVARRFLPLLGLTASIQRLRQSVRLAGLEQPLALALHRHELEEKTAHLLTGLSFRDRLALFDLIATLRLPPGHQHRAALLCQRLAGGLNTSIHAILAGPEVKGIIGQPEAGPPGRAARFLGWLQARQTALTPSPDGLAKG